MFKKIFYGVAVLAMLVAAFGAQGIGVQKAYALPNYNPWKDARLVSDTITAPDYRDDVNLFTAKNDITGDLGGCMVAPGSFGIYQLHATENLAADWSPLLTTYTHVRIRIEGTGVHNKIQGSWAVRINMNDGGLTELGCAVNDSAGVVDLVVAVPDGYGYEVTLSSTGAFIPDTLHPFKAWILESNQSSGGLVIDQTGDCGVIANRTIEATNQADLNNRDENSGEENGDYYTGVNFTGGLFQTFLDVPAGLYNLGIAETTANHEFVAYYEGGNAIYPHPELQVVDGGINILKIKPCHEATIPLKVESDVNITTMAVVMTPTLPGLNHDLTVGFPGVGLEAFNEKTFKVTPGFHWDFALVSDSPVQYNTLMYYNDFNPVVGDLIFIASILDPANTPFSWVDLCANPGYDFGSIELDPDGQLMNRYFNWFGDGTGFSCAPGYVGGRFLLSPATAHAPGYMTNDLVMGDNGWAYNYTPLGGAHWAFDAYVYPADPLDWLITVQGYFEIGDTPFITGPVLATSQNVYSLPVPAGEVALLRGPWTDQFGNTLYEINGPDNSNRDCVTHDVIIDTGTADDEIAPCYTIETPNADPQLANDWLLTPLVGPTTVGRYDYVRSLQHGNLADVSLTDGLPGFYSYDYLFAIEPADTDMLGHWAWSWVMAMYEKGLTTGLTPTSYGPDQPVTRAQMAMFIWRVLDKYSLPAGTAAAFSDVPTSYWAHDAIATLRAYGISNGCGSNKFCPEALVTRREMAKFIESTFRTLTTYGVPVYWDTGFHVLFPGLTFVDVPATDWANTWIEEMFWDNLTAGCMRDGLTLYYCPDANVTRGEMAKFIITAIQPAMVTQGFWPILSPSK